jgi:hypothetical protein
MSAKLNRNDVFVLITWNFIISNKMSIVSDFIELADSISNWTLIVSVLEKSRSTNESILFFLNVKYWFYSAIDFVEAFESIIIS